MSCPARHPGDPSLSCAIGGDPTAHPRHWNPLGDPEEWDSDIHVAQPVRQSREDILKGGKEIAVVIDSVRWRREADANGLTPAQCEHELAFQQFHLTNPHIYDRLVELAREQRTQERRLSVALLYEIIRQTAAANLKSDAAPKMSNDHRAYYARLIMRREPDLAGYFVVKAQRCCSREVAEISSPSTV